MTWQDGVARIGGFVPFDVWAAQELGALERGKEIGDVPEAYAALPSWRPRPTATGGIAFTPKAGEADGDEEDEDDDEDDKAEGGDDEE